MFMNCKNIFFILLGIAYSTTHCLSLPQTKQISPEEKHTWYEYTQNKIEKNKISILVGSGIILTAAIIAYLVIQHTYLTELLEKNDLLQKNLALAQDQQKDLIKKLIEQKMRIRSLTTCVGGLNLEKEVLQEAQKNLVEKNEILETSVKCAQNLSQQLLDTLCEIAKHS